MTAAATKATTAALAAPLSSVPQTMHRLRQCMRCMRMFVVCKARPGAEAQARAPQLAEPIPFVRHLLVKLSQG